MKLLKKLKDRYSILIIITSIIFFVLSFRLATLTIVEGEYYRDISDNKKIKEIYQTAPRGEIRDRYGRLLAGNKPSFTVQILKDELNNLEREDRNNVLLELTRLIEEDGVEYADDLPIELNAFSYDTDEIFIEESVSPDDKVIDLIVSNNLFPEILNTYYIDPNYEEHFQFITINRAVNALKDRGTDVPVVAQIVENELIVSFDENKNIDEWKKENDVSPDATAMQSVIFLIDNDESIIRKTIDHPISRKLIYELLSGRNLAGNLEIKDYSFTYDEEYLDTKKTLMKSFSNITLESSAQDDFVEIVTDSSMADLLLMVDEAEDENGDVEKVIPGDILINTIEEKGLDCPVTINIDEESNTVTYDYADSDSNKDRAPIDMLINFSKQNDLLYDFITDDEIKGIAQKVILENGYNPKISISKWEYTPLVDKANWLEKFTIEEDYNAEEAFEYLKEHYKIEKNLSSYEARVIMSLYDQLDKQGLRAYEPINIAYGIKDSTVAKIEEGFMETPGIQVSIEPVRYYPERETAAHILGYLGKISQSSEIEEYIKENEYSPNDIIGKTGIEEKFELELKGENGTQQVEVDSLGNKTKILDEEKSVPGNNIYLTIDLVLQKVAEDSLEYGLEKIREGGTFESKWGDYKFGTSSSKGRPYIHATSGSVVVTSVKTGELLAMANFPAYDPNLFSTGISSSDWESLFPENEEDLIAPRPLYNIAIQTAIQPGSTFKMVTALAALEKGLSPNQLIRDMGYVQVGNARFGCWIWNSNGGTHGLVDLYKAIEVSCNYYFYSLAYGYNPRTGESIGVQIDIDDISQMAIKLGLNDKTGIEIDIPREASGGVPNAQSKVTVTKSMLRNYLKNNIRYYIKEGEKFTDEDIDKKIEEIASWTELPETLSRNEVIRRLDEMGIDPEKRLPGERDGLADKIKYTYLNFAGWNITDTLNVTIGQGQNAYTPIQMTNYIATIANGGYKNDITVIDNIKNYDNSKTLYERETNPERIELNDYENLEHVKIGMRRVVSTGSMSSTFKDFPISVAAKTGTAQNQVINPVTGEAYDDYSWFVAFAPYDDPEIAVTVLLFQGGSGSYGAPIAREVIAQYFGLNNVGEEESLPFENGLGR